ncbi:MAG: DUF5908 family protein [Bacteroidota bacterium]
MPVIINEIVIKTNVEALKNSDKTSGKNDGAANMEEIVKQAVERVFEILEEKKER